MSSLPTHWFEFAVPNAIHLILIFLFALLGNRLLLNLADSFVLPPESPARTGRLRDQQKHAADVLHRLISAIVWGIAMLTALPELGISPLPASVLGASLVIAIGIGAHRTIGDALSGVFIFLEDPFSIGDTIQNADTVGRVEQISLRRTLLRDSRGALVTIPNDDLRTVSNLNRDWSQVFVDIAIPQQAALDQAIKDLEAASSGLRADSAWSQAIVDGPRFLGVQDFDPQGATLRLQVRTAPTRQDEVSRELRRRVLIEFDKRRTTPVDSNNASSSIKPEPPN